MSIALPARPAPGRRLWTPRLVATLALFVVSAAFFCGIVGNALVHQADEQQGVERRGALLGAIEDLRNSGADFYKLDPRRIQAIERTAGLKDLRFENEPVEDEREVQSVLDAHGRIVGWFSWVPNNTMSDALGELRPLAALTAIFLVGFAGLAFWQIRRTVRDLGKSERLAWQLAHEDMLTGLPNHRKMIELIDAMLAKRHHGEVVTLAFLDLDGLKDVNDALGHSIGDDLLRGIAMRLKEKLPGHGVCGRYDGDEFAVAMRAPDMEVAEKGIGALVAELARPYWIDGQAAQVGVTAGLAHVPSDGRNREELMRRADLALREAKRKQRGGVLRFAPAMDVEFDDRRFLERELRRAIEAKSLDVHYQAIVSSDGHRLLGAEALLRWTHPERGAIPPSRFVAVAERCGLMPQLGEFVLRRALTDLKRWPSLYMSVNLSPVQVKAQGLVETVAGLLKEYGVPASRLVLEVTEGVLIDNPDEARARLAGLQGLGVKLALDDFGTGYSSLTYLQRFKFDKLKIDKGFVDPLARDTESQALVQAIVALGRALNMTLLAEGVETEEQRVLLRLAGCNEMQGYLFARPTPREALDKLVEEASAPAPARATA
ncbi:putative bifunctional diguanylate cyclase/phosphodiesterase [Rhodoplanes sp. Z2-YC6860]|uniref:putative bifunctional diguanylate cyclase/phosphodiesterase n=1 Tax=Rhodoplanes sp. Z2-YC6860 TaxID=674703 RepID=UPI00078BDE9A|nr:bifunctional diguanylate cyclase/phosphodiesterase [Rhodoplanes sp. Z2-YC6860]AMN42525.1 diguanylate cyclase [Rhodoplanes sp. Z2-YC6860]